MAGQEHQGTFTVTMLAVLRGPFEEWLASRGLEMGTVPDAAPDTYIVVPQEFLFKAHPTNESG